MRNDLALTGVQTEANFASLRHHMLNIRSDQILGASQSEIVQITQMISVNFFYNSICCFINLVL